VSALGCVSQIWARFEAVLPSDDELRVGKGKLRALQLQVRKPGESWVVFLIRCRVCCSASGWPDLALLRSSSPVFYTAPGWGEQAVLWYPLRTFFRCCAWSPP